MTARIFRKTAAPISARDVTRTNHIPAGALPVGSLDTWTGTVRGPLSLLL